MPLDIQLTKVSEDHDLEVIRSCTNFLAQMDANVFGPGRLFLWVWALLLSCQLAFAVTPAEESGIKPLAIEFFKSKVVFSGTVDAKTTTDALATTILSVLPDLKVVNSELTFDPKVSLPDLNGIKTLLLEVALSTNEGVIEISDRQLIVGGLTDSVVVSSVLRIRAAPILGTRQYREQICLVSASDLPSIPIRLSTGEIRKPFSLDPALPEKKEVHFEPPGIIITKLLSLIEGTSDLVAMLPSPITEPVGVAGPVMPQSATDAAIPLPPPPDPYEELGSLLFIRNGIFPQTGEDEKVAALAVTLNSEPWITQDVTLQAQTYRSSSESFAGWLSERRLAAAVRQLTAAGIDPARLKPERVNSTETIDRGEVKIRCLKPVPPLVQPPLP